MEILFPHIYIYLYIICENDTSISYFHIYTFSFLEELHPSLDSFHTQQTPGPGEQNKVDSELIEQGTVKSSGRMHCVAGKAIGAC